MLYPLPAVILIPMYLILEQIPLSMKIFFPLLVSFCSTALCFANTSYVTAVAAGSADGSSWANASADLQAMIDASTYGDTVWVAAGTYFPTKDPNGNANPVDPREKTFHLKNGVKVFGSFTGNETSLSQRTLSVLINNPSILQGDIGTANDSTDNVYHVVLSILDDSITTLDGFTITNGNAFGNQTTFYETVPVSAAWGAGMANLQTSTVIRNCIFSNNHCFALGGGMFNSTASVTVENCVFANNSTTDQGGGMDNEFASTIRVSNSVFYKNKATTGGGICNEINALLVATNCVLSGNHASGSGGGISSDSTLMKNCIDYGNNVYSKISNVSYSIIQGATVISGVGNSNADPKFVDSTDADGPDNLWRTDDDGLQVLVCSPAVDGGDAGNAPAKDLLDNVRYDAQNLGNAITDIGAYENYFDGPDMTLTVQGDTLSTSLKALSYEWVVCPGFTTAPGASNTSIYIATTAGSYSLILEGGGCAFTSACVNAGPSAIQSPTENPALSIFPNPSNGAMTLRADKAGEWIIRNSLGQTLQEVSLQTSNGFSATIDISSKGVLYITDISGMKTCKVIVAE
jgi:hypothetical protein